MTTGRINQVCRCHPELQQSSASATPLGDITTIINQSPDAAKQAGQVMMQRCCRRRATSRLPSLSYLMKNIRQAPSTTWWKTPSSAKHRAHNLTPSRHLEAERRVQSLKPQSLDEAWDAVSLKMSILKEFQHPLTMPQKHYNIEIPGATNSNRINQAQKAEKQCWKAEPEAEADWKDRAARNMQLSEPPGAPENFPGPPINIDFKFRKI